MSITTPALIRVAEGLYRGLLFVLPKRFRLIHRNDIAAAFRDACFDAFETRGTFGLFLTCTRGMAGLLIAAIRERFRAPGPGDSYATSYQSRTGLFSNVLQDVGFAARYFRRNPGFAITAIGIIALGIGATTTIFSVVDGVVLRPLPYPRSGAIVYVDNSAHSPLRFRDWQSETTSLESWTAAWGMGLDLIGDSPPVRLNGAAVTRNFFDTFGGQPALGRLFVPGDFNGQPQVVVISYGLWQGRFGADPDILGRSLQLGNDAMVVVGVLDPRFQDPETVVRAHTDLWTPLDETRADLQEEGLDALQVVARLKDGVSIQSAQAELDALVANLAESNPRRYRRGEDLRTFPLVPLHTATVADVDDALLMLLGAVGLLLLIACANVANLFLARGTDRAREMSLRTALGAGRGRLVGQLLTESVVLAFMGGAIGVLLAFVGVWALEALNPGDLPRADAIGVNIRVLAFAVSVAFATGILFGVAPALRTSKNDHGSALKETSTTVTSGKSGNLLRNTLVVAEIALALMLATGAGLLINSFVRLKNVDPGFVTDQLVTIPLVFGPEVSREQKATDADRLLERIAQVPGVDGVTGGVLVPFDHFGGMRCCRTWDALSTNDGNDLEGERILIHPVSANYFTVLGAHLRGRDLRDDDRSVVPAPAVISQTLAAKMFGTDNPLGKRFEGYGTAFQVVGVVDGFRQWGLDQGADTEMFVPYQSFIGGARNYNVVVKTAQPLATMTDNLRRAVWDVLPTVPVNSMYTMRQRINESMRTPRFYSIMLATFGAVALLLAAGGVYGSMLYNVGRRSRELGVRVALGATSSNVVGMIVRQGGVMAALGITIGLVGSIALGRALESFMFGITTTDLPTLGAVAGILAAAAIVASYLPARRAACVDPVTVLRSD